MGCEVLLCTDGQQLGCQIIKERRSRLRRMNR